jgi:hypothetical protein
VPDIKLVLDGTNILKDETRDIIHVYSTITITALEMGMKSGRASVAIILDLGDKVAVVESSLALLSDAVKILDAKYS